ncbi:MAG TPA: hypothetical protein VLU92_12205 [Candidatus Dormibacteraeota bacterium]|nr:hypothetical protein [Candidatus Dormibacteraeota bacterium]
MTMRWPVVVALLGLAACSQSATAVTPTPPVTGQLPSASTASSASPSAASGAAEGTAPNPTTLAVMVDLFAGANTYDVSLVSFDARVVARAHARLRTAIPDASELPYVSASNTRVYYLDGDRQIRWLKPDGTTGEAEEVPAGPNVHATFAVTPDDSRIAVALLDYSVNPVQLTLYVEDMGGAHHAVIFSSTSHYVWPVAWHSGQLVVAYLGPTSTPFKSKMFVYSNHDLTSHPYGPNPYGGINFHVINPATGQREVIISGGGASGLLTRAGTAVTQGQAVDWSGGQDVFFPDNDYGSVNAVGSLSPDGKAIAACCDSLAATGSIVLWYPGGAPRTLAANGTSGDWVGWFDNAHLITGFNQRADGNPSVVDLNSGSVEPVDVHGIVAAMLPGGLDS